MDKKSDRLWADIVRKEAARKGAVYPWNLFSYKDEDTYRPTVTASFPHASRETSYIEELSKASTCDYLGGSPSPVASPAKQDKATSPPRTLKDGFAQTSERHPGSLSRVLGADSCNPYLRFPASSSRSKPPTPHSSSSANDPACFFKSPPAPEDKESILISQRYLREPTDRTPRLQQTLSAADLIESEKSKTAGDVAEDLDGSLRCAIEFLQLLSGEAGAEPTTEKLQSRLDLIEGRFGSKGKTVALKIIHDLAKEPLSATYSDKFSGVVTWGQLGLERDRGALTMPKPAFGNSWNEEMKNVTTTLGTFMGAVHQLRDDLSSLRAAASNLK